MKKYTVLFSKEFYIKAESEDEAEKIAVELCAKDPECLMPHNMNIDIQPCPPDVAESYFD